MARTTMVDPPTENRGTPLWMEVGTQVPPLRALRFQIMGFPFSCHLPLLQLRQKMKEKESIIKGYADVDYFGGDT